MKKRFNLNKKDRQLGAFVKCFSDRSILTAKTHQKAYFAHRPNLVMAREKMTISYHKTFNHKKEKRVHLLTLIVPKQNLEMFNQARKNRMK